MQHDNATLAMIAAGSQGNYSEMATPTENPAPPCQQAKRICRIIYDKALGDFGCVSECVCVCVLGCRSPSLSHSGLLCVIWSLPFAEVLHVIYSTQGNQTACQSHKRLEQPSTVAIKLWV